MSLLNLPLSSDLDRIGEQMHALAQAQLRLQGLLEAVLSITGELELPAVLRRIVRTAMDLSGARYGALGVLDEEGEFLAEFIPLGLGSQELANLSGVELPRGRGLLGHLIHHPDEPLRVAEMAAHPEYVGFPPATRRCARSSASRSRSGTGSTATSTSATGRTASPSTAMTRA
ncbi:hypothetical protein ACFQVA_02355 [Actinomadura keratinilytica]